MKKKRVILINQNNLFPGINKKRIKDIDRLGEEIIRANTIKIAAYDKRLFWPYNESRGEPSEPSINLAICKDILFEFYNNTIS